MYTYNYGSLFYMYTANHFSLFSPLILPAVILVVFEIPERTEMENVGEVEVCAVVLDGTLAREAIVTVASRDGSALGTFL